MEQIREIGARGWTIHVDFGWKGGVSDLSGWAGDSNCPHPKEYDPKDGHGFSTFEAMQDAKYADKEKTQWVEGPIATEWLALHKGEEDDPPFPEAIDFAYRHIMAIVPGAAR